MRSLSFSDAWASYSWKERPISRAIDGDLMTEWHPWSRQTDPHKAIFLLESPLQIKEATELVIQLHQPSGHGRGRFRLSVSHDPDAYANAEKRFAAKTIDDPWAKLAAVYHIVGAEEQLRKLLTTRPEAAAGIGDLHRQKEQWQQAIDVYDTVITQETTDVRLLSHRAQAHAALENWDLAQADWLRAIKQDPKLARVAFDTFRNAERWNEAAEFGQRLLERNPNDSILWLKVGVITYLAEPDGEYPEFCSRLTKQFGETNDVTDVGRLIIYPRL